MKNNAEVIIVGCGPAGIFTALELIKSKPDISIIMLDKGRNIKVRKCPKATTENCVECIPCNISCGWGGAGAFSDGKLSLSKDVGGWLEEYIGAKQLNDYIEYVDEQYLKFGGNPNIVYNKDFADNLEYECSKYNLKLVKCPVRHLGTEKSEEIMDYMYEELKKQKNVTIYDLADVIKTNLEKTEKEIIVRIKKEEITFKAKYIIFAVGRSGADWLLQTCKQNGIPIYSNQVDMGVRVELPNAITDHLTKELYEFKIYNTSKTHENVVRTFCMNPSGFVSQENYDDENLAVVNGHSYQNKKSNLTNFALLVSANFTEPFKEPIKYGKYIASLGNMLTGGKIMVQRLKDLKEGKRSTKSRIKNLPYEITLKDAIPGDLSFVFPQRILTALLETLENLDNVCPGINGDSTVLYGVEVKFYSSQVEVNNNLETPIKNVYAIGDGAGITRGLMQASISGVVAAKDIITKLKEEKVKIICKKD